MANDTFTAVDLSQLSPPDVVEELDFETVLSEMLNDLMMRDPELQLDVHDPGFKILEVAAYRELLIRQRINNSAKSIMLAHAAGADLDNLGALPWMNVERLIMDEGDTQAVPPIAPVYESDDDYRKRLQLSLEGFSTAGPEGAYIFHALSADGNVKDASAVAPKFKHADLEPSVQSQLPPNVIVLEVVDDAGLTEPMPGDVAINILSNENDGTASNELIDNVTSALSAVDVRPLTDRVIGRSANIVDYTIEATLHFYAGPGGDEAFALAQQKIEAYTSAQHKLGLDVTKSGIYAALHQPGVQRVELSQPATNIVVDRSSAAHCSAIILSNGGVDE